MIYVVYLSATNYTTGKVMVEADSYEEAKEKALDNYKKADWDNNGIDDLHVIVATPYPFLPTGIPI